MSTTRKYELYSKEFRKNSHATFAQMRIEAPLIKEIGINAETQIWFVTRNKFYWMINTLFVIHDWCSLRSNWNASLVIWIHKWIG